jgi:hypothetical protein
VSEYVVKVYAGEFEVLVVAVTAEFIVSKVVLEEVVDEVEGKVGEEIRVVAIVVAKVVVVGSVVNCCTEVGVEELDNGAAEVLVAAPVEELNIGTLGVLVAATEGELDGGALEMLVPATGEGLDSSELNVLDPIPIEVVATMLDVAITWDEEVTMLDVVTTWDEEVVRLEVVTTWDEEVARLEVVTSCDEEITVLEVVITCVEAAVVSPLEVVVATFEDVVGSCVDDDANLASLVVVGRAELSELDSATEDAGELVALLQDVIWLLLNKLDVIELDELNGIEAGVVVITAVEVVTGKSLEDVVAALLDELDRSTVDEVAAGMLMELATCRLLDVLSEASIVTVVAPIDDDVGRTALLEVVIGVLLGFVLATGVDAPDVWTFDDVVSTTLLEEEPTRLDIAVVGKVVPVSVTDVVTTTLAEVLTKTLVAGAEDEVEDATVDSEPLDDRVLDDSTTALDDVLEETAVDVVPGMLAKFVVRLAGLTWKLTE